MGVGGVKPTEPASKEPCKCCGRRNHVKKDCRFREKECNSCGLVGHLAAVCWAGNGPPTTTKAPDPKQAPAGTDLKKKEEEDPTEAPWTCHQCYTPCPNQKLLKCPRPACAAKRLQADKQPADPKALKGKDALRIIDSADKTAAAD